MALLERNVSSLAPSRRSRRPTAPRTRSPPESPSRCAASWRRCSAPTACSAGAGDIVRYASDASPYRLFPRAVVMARDAGDVAKVLAYGRAKGIPVTFRAGGTSLNGQGQSDGILVDVRRHFGGVAVEEDGAIARVKPGTVLGHANRVLAPHGRKLGPDPASTDIATVGGVVANNSGGMRCGVTRDSYSTVRSMTFVLPSGTTIDTAAPGAAERFAAEEPELAAGLAAIRDEIRADAELSRAHPPQVRDQEHDRLPALRLPRRRRAAGDLPPPLSSAPRARSPSSPRRSSRPCRCRPARPPPGSTSPTSTRRSPRSATSSRPAPPRSS